jgi:cysteine synthase
MIIKNDVIEAIGNTPLIKLKRASEATGCTILGKAEFMNPGQSVKDRAGKWMILEAEKRGELKPGGLVVEATAGNTGIGLAVVASARGYRTLIIIPETQSQEKKDMLRLCGAELVEVPALPFANPNNYQHVGRRLADQLRKKEPNGVLFADQWNNLDNAKAHYESTGPEIWEQTQGKIDGFICSVGTGGTLAGTSAFLKGKNRDIVTACADPHGFGMYELFKHGEVKSTPGDSITEGIGLGRVTPVIKTAKVDDAYLISDEEAVRTIYELLEHEGLCLGGSTGINVAGAVRLAKQLGPGKTIVTILADSGNRYQSKLFNPDFMRSKNLPVPEWLERPQARRAVRDGLRPSLRAKRSNPESFRGEILDCFVAALLAMTAEIARLATPTFTAG